MLAKIQQTQKNNNTDFQDELKNIVDTLTLINQRLNYLESKLNPSLIPSSFTTLMTVFKKNCNCGKSYVYTDADDKVHNGKCVNCLFPLLNTLEKPNNDVIETEKEIIEQIKVKKPRGKNSKKE